MSKSLLFYFVTDIPYEYVYYNVLKKKTTLKEYCIYLLWFK